MHVGPNFPSRLPLDPAPWCRVHIRHMATATQSGLTIGRLAQAAGVGIPTVRFYERRGLLPRPQRRASGYRSFDPDVVQRIRFIRHAQELGFSLKEVEDLLDLRMDPRRSCADVRQRAMEKIADIDAKVAGLARMRKVLDRLVETCPGDAPTTDCPILEALEDNVAER
jgi:MerR family copper efflux transcriptional regulator